MTVNNNGEAALDLACRFGHVHVGTTFLTCFCLHLKIPEAMETHSPFSL